MAGPHGPAIGSAPRWVSVAPLPLRKVAGRTTTAGGCTRWGGAITEAEFEAKKAEIIRQIAHRRSAGSPLGSPPDGTVAPAARSAFNKMDELGERSQAASLEKLTPAERERYEAWEARSAAASAGASPGQPRRSAASRQGPPGRPARSCTASPRLPKRRDDIEDPAAWEQQMLAERAVRDETRAAYLAPARHPVRITRVATRGKTQVREVADQLASSGLAARPDLVYGAYRVPDLISPGRLGGEKGAIVEWDIVARGRRPAGARRAAGASSRSTPGRPGRPRGRRTRARSTRILRSTSSRAPASGQSGRSAIARDVRHPQGRRATTTASSRIDATVRGVHVLVGGAGGARAPPPQAHRGGSRTVRPTASLDVLQWDAIAQAVHPVRQQRRTAAVAVRVPPAHAAGAAARVPRDRRRRPGGCVRARRSPTTARST